MLVDAHAHVWRPHPDFADPGATIVSPAMGVPVELFDEYRSEHAVDRAVLVQPIYPGEDNGYVAECAAARPAELAAVCVVDPRRPGAPERLDYWVRERGCRGLRLRPRLRDEAAVFGQPETFPLWERARSLGAVVSLLLGPEHLPAAAALAARFPEVDIVLDHLAHPDPAASFQSLLDLARHPRVHLKLSGFHYFSRRPYPYPDCAGLVRALYDAFGPERLLWGSDFPHSLFRTGYARSLALARRAFSFFRPDDLALILGRNAARLYWREGVS